MAIEPQGFTIDLIRVIKQFANGSLTREEFYNKHKIKDREKWEEMKFIVRDMFLFNSFIMKLPIGSRFKALKEVQGLTEKEIKLMDFSSGIQRYFKDDLEEEINTSFFYYELAILFDVPVEFLMFDNPIERNVDINSFYEYKKTCREVVDMKNVCKETLNSPRHRIIKGYRVDNSNLFLSRINSRELIVRVDKQVNFFSFEIFINSYLAFDNHMLKKLNELLDSKVSHIYYSDALLRDVYKLTLFGTYRNSQREKFELNEYLKEFKLRYRSKEVNIL